MRMMFDRFSRAVSDWTGSPTAFVLSVAIVLVWGITGPFFRFSDTWQLVINTGTTIGTWIMVFLIQSAQNRDALAMHIKLDALIKATDGASNRLMALERQDEREAEAARAELEEARGG